MTNKFKQDILNGVHQPGDTYRVALYTSSTANLDKNTTAYTTTGEVVGTGYTAGGQTLTGFSVGLTGDVAHLSFNDAAWPSSSITADAALVYNASRGNAAIAVYSFANTTSTNGTFTLDFPAAGASAMIRVG